MSKHVQFTEKTENELIAEFMGIKYYKDYGHHRDVYYDECVDLDNDGEVYTPEWNTSWDWLMPVVEKIGNISSIEITIRKFTAEHSDKSVSSSGVERTFWPEHAVCKKEKISYLQDFSERKSLIDNTFDRVVEFIKWYNENK